MQKLRSQRTIDFRLFWTVLCCLFTGCRTTPDMAPIDLSAPGWQVRQGQAIWRNKSEAPEIVGEVVLGTHPNGGAFIQFLKTPLPLLTANLSAQGWRIEFIPEKRRVSGHGVPPRQLIWLHLLRALQGAAVPEFSFSRTKDGSIQIENRRSGERVTLFLNEG